MPGTTEESFEERFERMTLVERLAFLAGGGIHMIARAVESAVDQTAAVVARARKSYRQGLDPNILEAKILDETVGGQSASSPVPATARDLSGEVQGPDAPSGG